MRVLIVDDEPLAQNALAGILGKRDDIEQFDIADDAVDALEKLNKNAYDLLLLDINMPEMSRIELLDKLQGQRIRRVPSVVFMTAHEEHAITAFEKHALDYVLKPFSSERIGEALDVAFRKTEGERPAKLIGSPPQLHDIWHKPSPRIGIKAKG